MLLPATKAFREAFARVHAEGGGGRRKCISSVVIVLCWMSGFTSFDPNLRGPMIKGSAGLNLVRPTWKCLPNTALRECALGDTRAP